MPLDAFRAHFAQTTQTGIFFDNASMGPVAPEVTAAMTACMELRQAMPMKYYRYAAQLFPACQKSLSRLIGCDPDELVFTESVAYGINCAARALPLSRGDNVILCDREFSSNVYPWLCLQRDQGVEARIVPHDGGGLTLDRLEQYADTRTRAVTVSSVEFSDGFATDLDAIGHWCRDHRAYFIVDCAQSLGVMPIDVRRFHVDILAGLSSKWLLGPFSTGFLYVRRDLAQGLQPPFAGADSVKTDVGTIDRDLDWLDGPARFGLSLPNAPGIAGLYASLSLMEQTGLSAIHQAAWQISGQLIHGLQELGAKTAPCALRDETRSTIVSFTPASPQQTYLYLREHGVACSLRGSFIRMGIHGFNTAQEVDQVLAILRPHLKSF